MRLSTLSRTSSKHSNHREVVAAVQVGETMVEEATVVWAEEVVAAGAGAGADGVVAEQRHRDPTLM